MEKHQIAHYYNRTQNHYLRWWNLKESLSLHYGMWGNGVNDFSKALWNTNVVMADLADIKVGQKVMDAGCGVGGAAIYLAAEKGAIVQGVTLSEKQLDYARATIKEKNLTEKISFELADFTNTPFEDGSFDVIWACESTCHIPSKRGFFKEAFRLLKPGGKIIINDYFLVQDDLIDKKNWVKKWCDSWMMADLVTTNKLEQEMNQEGFRMDKNVNQTILISKSAKRMYLASIFGAIPAELYNVTHPKIDLLVKHHYRSGYYQYRALQQNLWSYHSVVAIKEV
jgi:tocopherol O-methyltransferase